MGHRQGAALPGLQVVFLVGIPGEQDGLPPVCAVRHPGGHTGHDVHGFLCAQGPADKIVLHVHNDQNIHIFYLQNIALKS